MHYWTAYKLASMKIPPLRGSAKALGTITSQPQNSCYSRTSAQHHLDLGVNRLSLHVT